MAARNGRRGQAAFEFALMYGLVIVPLIFGLIFVAQAYWVWHSIVEFTRDGARYAATHCWVGPSGPNVTQYMQTHVPPNIDEAQFQSGGAAQINVDYFAHDTGSGELVPFGCAVSCDPSCAPDAVTVSVTGYQFQHYVSLLMSVTMPPFPASQAMGNTGCDQTGACTP
jgi:hypothetical protein